MGTYTITFDTKGGETAEDITAESGSWQAIAKPVRAGHVFDGWVVTGHDRATAAYSRDGGETAVSLDADPALVETAADGSTHVRDLGDGRSVLLSARWRTLFGGTNAGCKPIEMASFTPICGKGEIGGSEPLTLDVPVPVFAPSIPPPECVCLDFTGETKNITVTMNAGHGDFKATGTASVAIKPATDDCCDGSYTVDPIINITIPECVTPDATLDENDVELGSGGTIHYKLSIKDCVPQLEITPKSPVNVGGGPCFGDTKFKVSAVSYLGGEEGGDPTKQTAAVEFNLKHGTIPAGQPNAGCLSFTLDDIKLDMTAFDIGSGGGVFRGGNGNLYTDGSEDEEAPTWYGGGVGNLAVDKPEDVESRGPVMRGDPNHESPIRLVPFIKDIPFRLAKPKGNGDDEVPSAKLWCSGRKTEGADGELASDTPEGAAFGNLNVVLPTGWQWYGPCLAINLSTFVWNPSGLLSQMEETETAVLVAPGPVAFSKIVVDGSSSAPPTINGVDVAGLNVSGLATPEAGESTGAGLAINTGDGLRIFGADARSTSEVAEATKGRIGKLEVYRHDGDFLFNYDGKMVMNDEAEADPADEALIAPYDDTVSATQLGIDTFNRDSDCTVTIATVDYTSTDYWRVNDSGVVQGRTKENATDIDDYVNHITGRDGAYFPGTQVKDGARPLHAAAKTCVTNSSPQGAKEILAGVTTSSQQSDINAATLSAMNKIVDALTATLGSMTRIMDATDELKEVVTRMNYMLGTFYVAQLHFARSGVLMAADTKEDCSHVTRRYRENAP